MQPPDISESEWVVMEALWQGAPQTASEITKSLRPTTNWAENTVRTLLTRLVEKGALKKDENASGTRVFSPAVQREARGLWPVGRPPAWRCRGCQRTRTEQRWHDDRR